MTENSTTEIESTNLATIRSYLSALESGSVGEELPRFFTHDAEQIELPNSQRNYDCFEPW